MQKGKNPSSAFSLFCQNLRWSCQQMHTSTAACRYSVTNPSGFVFVFFLYLYLYLSFGWSCVMSPHHFASFSTRGAVCRCTHPLSNSQLVILLSPFQTEHLSLNNSTTTILRHNQQKQLLSGNQNHQIQGPLSKIQRSCQY